MTARLRLLAVRAVAAATALSALVQLSQPERALSALGFDPSEVAVLLVRACSVMTLALGALLFHSAFGQTPWPPAAVWVGLEKLLVALGLVVLVSSRLAAAAALWVAVFDGVCGVVLVSSWWVGSGRGALRAPAPAAKAAR